MLSGVHFLRVTALLASTSFILPNVFPAEPAPPKLAPVINVSAYQREFDRRDRTLKPQQASTTAGHSLPQSTSLPAYGQPDRQYENRVPNNGVNKPDDGPRFDPDGIYLAQRLGQSAFGSRQRPTSSTGTAVASRAPSSTSRPSTTGAGTGTTTQLRRLRPPNVVGDFYGGGSGLATITVPRSFHTFGRTVIGMPTDPNSVLVFELDGTPPFNDFTTVGPGSDVTGDGNMDTFAMSEPVPPTDAPTSPGPNFTFDGGTVVYTNSPTETTAQNGAFADDELWYASYSYTGTVEIPPGVGVAVRRIKIAENNSPIPRDRYYLDFKHFRDVKGGFGDVSRYTFGFEKTFSEGRFSFDTRLPFAATLDVDQFASGMGSNSGLRSVESGNVTFILKQVFRETEQFLVSGGLGVAVPTGSDTRLFLSDGTPVLAVENKSVHVLPYLAGLWSPGERFYLQSFLQVDVAANGNPVRGNIAGGVLPQIGVVQDATLLFVDVSSGYWVYRDRTGSRLLRGLAGIAELHYNTTSQDADIVTAPGIDIRGLSSRFDVLNATFGFQTEIGEALTITTAMTFPLRNRDDRQFDNEIAVLANLFF